MNNDMVSNLKRAVLSTLAIRGAAGFTGVFEPNDLAFRACAELIAEGTCREDSDEKGNFLLVITRKGIEQAQ